MECHVTLPLKQWQWMRQQDVKGSRWCIFDEVEKELTFFLSLPWVMTRIHFIQHHKIMSLLIYLFHHLQHKFTSLGLICGASPPPRVFKMWFHFLGKWRGSHFQFSTKCSQGFLWVASGLQLNNPHFKFWLKIINTEDNSFISFPIKKIKIKKSGRYVDKNIGYCHWQ